MCGCNTAKKPKSSTPSSMLSSSGNFTNQSIKSVVDTQSKSQMVTVEYAGAVAETFSITSKMDRNIRYRFGNNDLHRTRSVFLGDAEWLIGLSDGQGRPQYRILNNTPIDNVNDPAAFVGIPITA